MTLTPLLTGMLAIQMAPGHAFVYVADKDLQSVSVAGNFNGWDKTRNPMTAVGRTWKTTIDLPVGRQQYKFVLNGSTWILDPKAKALDDGTGNLNSVFTVAPEGFDKPAAIGDGEITTSALAHSLKPPYVLYDAGKLRLSLRTRVGDVAKVSVVVDGKTLPMAIRRQDEWYALYSVVLPWDGITSLHYTFVLQDGDKSFEYGQGGVCGPQASPFALEGTDIDHVDTPAWPCQTVTYQIFPDRFANGDPSNDPANVTPWTGKPSYRNHFGGDFAGVRQHLDYLHDLGVGAVYFNPIFQSKDNHRYATGDYMRVDPELGTEYEFISLTREMKAKGIKTILDGVFNHTAPYFWAFQDVIKNGEKSAYKDWYFIKSYPVTVTTPPPYDGWYGLASMPKLNTENPDARAYLLSVPKVWDAKAEIAGWRLDAANEVAADYWPEFRKTVKADDPNRWIIGEIWGDGSKWLHGDMFDSVMGYQFRTATVEFLAGKTSTPTEYLNQLQGVYDSYAPAVSRNLLNVLSTHDTERFLTLCHGNKNLAMLGATMLLTWPGAPSIYYGDELGMEGGRDPDNRRPMRWDTVADNPMLAHYRALIQLRNGSPALQHGEPVILASNDSEQTLAFGRVLANDVVITVLNRSDKPQTVKIPLTTDLKSALNGRTQFLNALDGKRVDASRNRFLVVHLSSESSAVLLPAEAHVSSHRFDSTSSRPVIKSAISLLLESK